MKERERVERGHVGEREREHLQEREGECERGGSHINAACCAPEQATERETDMVPEEEKRETKG